MFILCMRKGVGAYMCITVYVCMRKCIHVYVCVRSAAILAQASALVPLDSAERFGFLV